MPSDTLKLSAVHPLTRKGIGGAKQLYSTTYLTF